VQVEAVLWYLAIVRERLQSKKAMKGVRSDDELDQSGFVYQSGIDVGTSPQTSLHLDYSACCGQRTPQDSGGGASFLAIESSGRFKPRLPSRYAHRPPP